MNLWLSRSLNFLGRMSGLSVLRRGVSLLALTLFTSIAALAEPGWLEMGRAQLPHSALAPWLTLEIAPAR